MFRLWTLQKMLRPHNETALMLHLHNGNIAAHKCRVSRQFQPDIKDALTLALPRSVMGKAGD
jgi:hypothetical protein